VTVTTRRCQRKAIWSSRRVRSTTLAGNDGGWNRNGRANGRTVARLSLTRR
jgi:hypothetical protein